MTISVRLQFWQWLLKKGFIGRAVKEFVFLTREVVFGKQLLNNFPENCFEFIYVILKA